MPGLWGPVVPYWDLVPVTTSTLLSNLLPFPNIQCFKLTRIVCRMSFASHLDSHSLKLNSPKIAVSSGSALEHFFPCSIAALFCISNDHVCLI